MNPLDDDCLLMWTLLSISVGGFGWYWSQGRKSSAGFTWLGCFLVTYLVHFALGSRHHPWWAWVSVVAQVAIIYAARRAQDPLEHTKRE